MSSKEYHKEYSAKWAKENREKCRKYQADYRARHPKKAGEYMMKRRAEHPEIREAYLKKSRELRARTCRRYSLKKYGLTEKDYQILLDSQNGVCAICKQICQRSKGLSVDHCHKTGKVRGLLCSSCNLALGNIKENVTYMRNMIKYSEENCAIVDYTEPNKN